MLQYAILFLVIALVCGGIGIAGIAGTAIGLAKVLFFIFLALFAVSFRVAKRGI